MVAVLFVVTIGVDWAVLLSVGDLTMLWKSLWKLMGHCPWWTTLGMLTVCLCMLCCVWLWFCFLLDDFRCKCVLFVCVAVLTMRWSLYWEKRGQICCPSC